MTTRRFTQVDVFTDTPLLGNPLAVVHDAEGLSDAQMASFARWTNLSETTFLLPPTSTDADYRVRIFTPRGELPFAGHPTLGSCHAWLEAGGGWPHAPREIVQECGIGLIRIRRNGERMAFAAPALKRRDTNDAELAPLLAALGLQRAAVKAAQWLDNGPVWLGLLLDSVAAVHRLTPDHAALKTLPKVGVIASQPVGADTQFEVRAFAASIGVAEDPVTGSLNASLAQWLIASGIAPSTYVVAQGTQLGRRGRVHLERIGEQIWVGGQSHTCVRGEMAL